MTLVPNDECYVQIHGIVCLNMPILGKNLYLRTVNNVVEETFHFSFMEKSFFNFRVQKAGFFVKHVPKICSKIGKIHVLKTLDHIFVQIIELLCAKRFPTTSRQKDKIRLIPLEAGQI